MIRLSDNLAQEKLDEMVAVARNLFPSTGRSDIRWSGDLQRWEVYMGGGVWGEYERIKAEVESNA